MNQAEIERLRARIAELHECLTKCAESAYEAGVADERERCAKLAADERHVYSNDEWRVRCEVADAIRDPDAGA